MGKAEFSRKFVSKLVMNPLSWSLPIIIWGLLVVISLNENLSLQTVHHEKMAVEEARNILRLVKLTRLWNARHGGVYVPVTETTQPNKYLDTPHRDLVDQDGKKYTMVNPAFMTRQMAELISRDSGVTFHITSLNPIRPANKADDWETHALNLFENGLRSHFEKVLTEKGENQFRYMEPLIVKKPCLKCHEVQGYELGDVRGGISVYFDVSEIYAHHGEKQIEVHRHVLVFVVVSFLILVFLYRTRTHLLELDQIYDQQEMLIKQRTEELEALAITDSLTGLLNRNETARLFEQELVRAQRYEHPFSVFMLDIDFFKSVNDTHGHQVGDQVLTAISHTIREYTRKSDIVGRYGGEEFIIVMPETTGDEALILAERLRAAVQDDCVFITDELSICVTVSIGIANYPQHGTTMDLLIKNADIAMYEAKAAGRNKVVVHR